MGEPDYTFAPKEGEDTRVTLRSRARPWHLRINKRDIYVVVECDEEPPVGEEDIVEAEGASDA